MKLKKSILKNFTILLYISVFVAIGLYFQLEIMTKILKVLGITCLVLIVFLLLSLGIFFVKNTIQRYYDLFYLIRNNKYYRANIIIEKKYNRVDNSTKKIYDIYKLIINNESIEKVTNENINISLEQIDNCIKIQDLPDKYLINCFFLKADNCLSLYNITNDEKYLSDFQTAVDELSRIMISTQNNQDNRSYYNYEVSRSNLLFKAYNVTNDTQYLEIILTNLMDLKECITEKKNNKILVLYIEYYLSRIYASLYNESLEQCNFDNALRHIKNIEQIIDDKSLSIKNKKYGKMYLICIYQLINTRANMSSILKKYDMILGKTKFSKKEKAILKRMCNLPSVEYPVSPQDQLTILSPKAIMFFFVIAIVVLTYTSIVIFKPTVNIDANRKKDIVAESSVLGQIQQVYPDIFLKDLYNNLLESGLPINDELSTESSVLKPLIYLDEKEQISLMCLYPLSCISVSIYGVKNMEWDSDIALYLIAIIQADNMSLERNEISKLINSWNNVDERSINYIGDRKYIFSIYDNSLHLDISNKEDEDKAVFKPIF